MIIAQANQDPSNLSDNETIKVVGNIMKTNVAACSSIGSYFYPQIGRIYLDMLSMYRATSSMISDSVIRDGELRCSTSNLDMLIISRPNRHQDAQSSRPSNYQERDPEAHRYLRGEGGRSRDGQQ